MTVVASTTAGRVLDAARSQLGVSEHPAYSNQTPYTRWYGLTGPWCAMFVSWCLHHGGFPLAITTSKGFAYCPYGVQWFKDHGAWAGPKHTPKPGDVVFFDFPGDGVNRVSHVGLVEGVLADGRVATIEGNTNGAGSRTGGNVMRHNRSVAGGIVGYGIITYQDQETPEMRFIEVTDGADKGKLFFDDGKNFKHIPDPPMFYELARIFPNLPTVKMNNALVWEFVKKGRTV